MGFIRSLLKFLQFCSVIAILFVVIRHLLPGVQFFSFAQPLLDFSIMCVSRINPIINGVDFSLAFVMLPWIVFIIFFEILSKITFSIEKQSEKIAFEQGNKKILKVANQEKIIAKKEIEKKHVVYVVAKLVFSKFTISDVSEEEMELKKEDIKSRVLQDAEMYKGKAIEGVDFDDDETVAVIFLSQEDALNFVFKLKSTVLILDDDIQNYGYGLHFRVICDLQGADSQKNNIFEYLEKVLKTSEENEVSVTSTFAQRYMNFGSMKHVSFASKGSYMIQRQKTELYRLDY